MADKEQTVLQSAGMVLAQVTAVVVMVAMVLVAVVLMTLLAKVVYRVMQFAWNLL